MDHQVDFGRRHTGFGQRLRDALQHGLLGRARCRQDLGGYRATADLDGDVGEGAADIDADAHVTR